ncbi:MAG: hypothetical protein CMH26_06865 [Micavibrio sp.]|nr:hypothetical protein [Micavibrio sp.]|tara:strand:- start:2700 stop:3005 length:306 start_codon:yes stop_codon:yes gene_type:complete
MSEKELNDEAAKVDEAAKELEIKFNDNADVALAIICSHDDNEDRRRDLLEHGFGLTTTTCLLMAFHEATQQNAAQKNDVEHYVDFKKMAVELFQKNNGVTP